MVRQKRPKYLTIKQNLADKISARVWAPGARLPSESELMEQFGASRQTVRQAIGGLVHEGLVVREHGRGSFVRHARETPVGQIAVVISSLTLYALPRFIAGIESVIRQAGYRAVLLAHEWDLDREAEHLRICLQERYDGIILFPAQGAERGPNLDLLQRAAELGIRAVAVETGHAGFDVPLIGIDQELAGYLAARHVIEAGHRRIAVLFKLKTQAGQLRLQGARRALAEHGLDLDDACIGSYTGPGNFDDPEATAFIEQFIRQYPLATALVCHGDLVASHSLGRIREAGLHVPEALSIMSHDNSDLSRITMPQLSTFHHPMEAIGREAAQVLLRLMEPDADPLAVPHEVLFRPILVSRGSVAPPPLVAEGAAAVRLNAEVKEG